MELNEETGPDFPRSTEDAPESASALFNNRSRIEIMASILKKARRATKKTHIMNQCNLSFRQLQRYLRSMRTRGLLKRENNGSQMMFETTGKGQKFLTRYSRIALLLGRRKPKP